MKKWKKIILIIILAPFALAIPVVAFSAMFGDSTSEIKPILDLKKEREKQLIHIAFDSERKIKENMKDPASFELIDRDYKFLSDTVYQVNITYSGTNSFGGRIQNKYLKMGILKFNPKDTTFTNIVKFEE
ncbi:MAG: hypothetical protein PHW29_05695 [Flavobacterium sp.]|nr:hypothetical protein [Flavobacterium sp.]